ncbi:MAG: hypothetical protein R2911_30730 [Caldilineaceae bacterium]
MWSERCILCCSPATISPIPSLMVRVASTVIVLVGGMMIIGNRLTLGEYVQFIVYLGLLNNGAQQITGAFERLQQGSAAAGRIGEVLHRWPKISDADAAIDPNCMATFALKMWGSGRRISSAGCCAILIWRYRPAKPWALWDRPAPAKAC